MLSGFKEFLMRGNVVELAVAVVVGSAFTAIVTAFTDKIVNPLVAALGGSPEFGLGFHIREGNPATFVDFGDVITAAINFLIGAPYIDFNLITPRNKLSETNARRKGLSAEEAAATETELLAEIRDLLQQQNGVSTKKVDPSVVNDDDPTGRHAE